MAKKKTYTVESVKAALEKQGAKFNGNAITVDNSRGKFGNKSWGKLSFMRSNGYVIVDKDNRPYGF